jgi:hypothetical protein
MDWNQTKEAYDMQQAWEKIYGKTYGYSSDFQKQLFQQGVSNLKPQFEGMAKIGLGDLNQRGFNSAIPYSNLMSNVNSSYAKSLLDLQNSISAESGRVAESQKAARYGSESSFLSQWNLLALQKKLGQKGFMDFLGQLFGQAGNLGSEYAGMQLGIK